MPQEAIVFVIAVPAIFAVFGLALAYVNMVAGDRAITFEEELAARTSTVSKLSVKRKNVDSLARPLPARAA